MKSAVTSSNLICDKVGFVQQHINEKPSKSFLSYDQAKYCSGVIFSIIIALSHRRKFIVFKLV